jgi:hypothetical protein
MRHLELVLVLLFILIACIVIICSFIVEHNDPLDSIQLGVSSTAAKRSRASPLIARDERCDPEVKQDLATLSNSFSSSEAACTNW